MSYWLISVPNEGKADSTQSFNSLNVATNGLSSNNPFAIPPLKVGTLDSLMALSDDLAKYDQQVGAIAKKIEKTYFDYVKAETADEKAADMTPLKVSGVSTKEYVEKFQWNRVRYPERSALRTLTDLITKETFKSDDAMRKQLADYNEVRAAFSAIEKKDTGSLLVKPLGPLIKPSDIIEKGHINTILVVVPRVRAVEFEGSYETLDIEGKKRDSAESERREKERQEREQRDKEKLAALEAEKKKIAEENGDEKKSSDGDAKVSDEKSSEKSDKKEGDESAAPKRPLPCGAVVPRSLKKIVDDATDEYILYRVVVMKDGAEYFKAQLRDKRYTIRPFVFNEAEEKEEKAKKIEFSAKKKQLWQFLLRWCATSYSEVFAGWIHIKAIRIYVEAVLRYGLPVNFSTFLLEPQKGKDKLLRKQLDTLYKKNLPGAGSNLTQSLEANEVDLSGLGADFYCYVYLPLQITQD